MKFLLTAINAKYIHSNPAVYSLKAFAAEYGKDVEILEYTVNQRAETILAGIYEKKPDVIGFSCYIWNWRMVQEILEEIPKILPGVPVWLGGPEVSYDGERLLERFSCVSGIMAGEGEETFLELMHFYEKKDRTLLDIKGLCLREKNTGNRNPLDLNRIPFFYKEEKMDTKEGFTNRIIYYESSRGCPYQCSYCLSSIDTSVRFRDVETVKKELQYFLDKKVKQVKFVDRTFNCKHSHAVEIWRYILENDNNVTNFHFEIAADILTEEELEILEKMRPGLVQLEIGVQSVNLNTLQEIRRKTDLEKVRKVVERLGKSGNVHRHLDLIAGLPFEDKESFHNSFNQVYAMRPEQLQLGFLKVLKGSLMHKKAEEYGINYVSIPPYEVLYSKWLSYTDVLSLKRVEEMLEIYYNSGQFRHTLFMLEKEFDHAFLLYEALAAYYERKGFFLNSPSRIYRYEVLLHFMEEYLQDKHLQKEHLQEKRELYRELLTYDLYLREKVKSRPEFLRDLSEYRQAIRKIGAEKTEHVEVFFYPVWEVLRKKQEKKGEKPFFVRFRYESRNPVTKEAQIQVEK